MIKVKLLEHTPNLEKVIAMAGKLCYSPSDIDALEENLTEENINKFIKMIMELGHESVLEHCSFTFAVEGVSRSLSHQLVRHRIASYSQQSQRYVRLNQFEYVIPKEIKKYKEVSQRYINHMKEVQDEYDNLVAELIEHYIADYYKIDYYDFNNINFINEKYHELRVKNKMLYSQFEKKAIENARYILPNSCETKIILTMNIRSLINFFSHRCCQRAQDEIRDLAHEMLKECRKVSPLIFNKVGAACIMNGYCPEGKMSCGLFPTLEEIKKGNN